jgi:hypothetical protein
LDAVKALRSDSRSGVEEEIELVRPRRNVESNYNPPRRIGVLA